MGSGNSALKHQLTDKQDASAELTQDCPGGRDSSGAMEDKKSRGARSDPESLADLRCQAETMWKSKLGNVELLDRQSYVELLQSVGHTFQEANILLKECPGSSYIRVKDFLDFLFASPKVDKEDVPTSLQSRDDGEKTEKAMIDSLQEALAASEKRADQQAQLLEELAEKVRQLEANQACEAQNITKVELTSPLAELEGVGTCREAERAGQGPSSLEEETKQKRMEEANKEDVEPLASSHEQSRLEKMMKKAWELLGQCMWKLEEERQDPEMHVARRYITWAGASGNYKGMKQLLEKALEIFEKHNEDHPETALTLICLSRAYQSLGDNATAKVTLSKAINILSFWSRAVLSLRFTMKEGPSVLRYIEEATFLGRFIDGAQLIYASYPGKFKDGWYILVKDDGEYSEESVACVYCCTREEGLGVHVPDPFDSTAPCYCRRIYGKGNHTNRNFEQFGYLYQVGPPYDEERMRKAQETADAMNAVLVRKDAKPEVFRERVAEATKRWEDSGEDPVPAWGCKWYDVWYKLMEKGVDAGQVPVVVYYPGMKGMGKVTMDDLKDPEKPLWDSDSSNRGLGGSQKAEVATLEHMGWDYREMDVTEFLHRSLPLGEKVVAWNGCKNGGKGQWTRGVIQDKQDLDPQGDQDSRFRWTVQEQDEEPFETDRIRFDHGEMDGLDEKLKKQNFVKVLNNCLPTGQAAIGNSPRQEWLWNGTPAMTFEIRSQDVAALQRLCSDVLCGDFEVAINRAAFNDETDKDVVQDAKIDYWQLQVDKAEFVRAYKYMLMSSTRLTRHQEEQLAQLDGSDSIHLKAAAGAGKTFVAAHKVFKTLIEHEEGQVVFVAPCKSLCLHFVRWLLMMDPGFGAEDIVSSRLKLMYKPYRNLMKVSISDTLQLEEISSTEQGFVLAVVDESHDIFCPGVEQGLLREILCTSKQRILLSDVSQSSALEQNFRDLEDYGRYHVVYLTEIVRSTERVVLGAKPFQLSPETEQATSIGANGPPLKSFLFDREGAASSPPFQDYCRHTISSLRHIVSSFPGLNLHHNVAILVPDLDFLSKFQTSLQKELKEEATRRKLSKGLDLINFEESLSDLTYLVSSDPVEHSKEEIIIDSIQNAKGLEQLIIIAVGMDAEINSKGDAHDLATRARLYQSITRAQLTAIVVNELLPHGWLAHLATCKLKEGQFQKLQAHTESDTAVATKLVQEIQARGLEENPSHQEDPPLETSATELPSPPEEPTVSAPSRSPNKPSAPETEQKKTVIEMRSSSVWDTSQNSTRSPIYDLKFDPMRPSAFQILKSQLRQVPLPATCPWPPEDVLLWWHNPPDVKRSDGKLERLKELFLFHRNGAVLRRREDWFFAASEASKDPELSARAVRVARRYIFEGRYAVAPAERRVTVTRDRVALASGTGAAAPAEVRFNRWGGLGGGGEEGFDLEELSERSKRPGAKPMAWPDQELSEETLKDLEEDWKEDGPWNPENLWFFTADLG